MMNYRNRTVVVKDVDFHENWMIDEAQLDQ